MNDNPIPLLIVLVEIIFINNRGDVETIAGNR
jgi:hypothetical protein